MSASQEVAAELPPAGEEMLPVPCRVTSRTAETHDSVTLQLEPVSVALPPFRPGQFSMLYRHGVGEIAVSISGDPSAGAVLTHTIRDVGAVSRALTRTGPGDIVGVRGPYGTSWDLDSAAGTDVLIVAGGVGLAPLRPAVLAALRHRASYGRLVLVAGARSPAEFLFRQQLADWSAMPEIDVELTIDAPARDWSGPVGFVTEPLARLALDPSRTTALLCGPEAMLRFCADVLLGKRLPASAIRVSLERNMKCGIGLCGHCQLGPLLVCRDGPVVSYEVARPLLATREL